MKNNTGVIFSMLKIVYELKTKKQKQKPNMETCLRV